MMIVLYGPWCNKTQNWLIEMSIFIDPLDFALHLGRQLTEKSFIVSDGYFSWYIVIILGNRKRLNVNILYQGLLLDLSNCRKELNYINIWIVAST